jgi:uncharacterized protein YdcH (DUF465 family)
MNDTNNNLVNPVETAEAKKDDADFARIVNSDPALESEIQELKQDTQELNAFAENQTTTPELVQNKEEEMEKAGEDVAAKMMANPETNEQVMGEIEKITPKSDAEAETILLKFNPGFVARLPFGKQFFLRKLRPI